MAEGGGLLNRSKPFPLVPACVEKSRSYCVSGILASSSSRPIPACATELGSKMVANRSSPVPDDRRHAARPRISHRRRIARAQLRADHNAADHPPLADRSAAAAALPAAQFGEASVMSVMPQAVVDCIVDLSRSGLSRAIIASKVGLSRSSVCAALWRRGEKPAAKVTRTNTNAQPPGAAACQASIEIAPHGCYWRILLQKCVEGCREQ